MSNFDHILNWTLKRGSHPFPGPDGGTCINEAAIVAHGFLYRPIKSHLAMPSCFSRPICRLALYLNDEATDAQRQRLLPFVTRLACADSPAVEDQREAYIQSHFNLDGSLPVRCSFNRGIKTLEGALAIGRQAEEIELDEVRDRMVAARTQPAKPNQRVAGALFTKLKFWLVTQQPENVE